MLLKNKLHSSIKLNVIKIFHLIKLILINLKVKNVEILTYSMKSHVYYHKFFLTVKIIVNLLLIALIVQLLNNAFGTTINVKIKTF